MTEEEHDDFNDKTYDGKQYDAAASAANDDDDDDHGRVGECDYDVNDDDDDDHGRVGECDYDVNDDRKCRKF